MRDVGICGVSTVKFNLFSTPAPRPYAASRQARPGWMERCAARYAARYAVRGAVRCAVRSSTEHGARSAVWGQRLPGTRLGVGAGGGRAVAETTA